MKLQTVPQHKGILLAWLLISWLTGMKGQDIQFSQPFNTPVTLSPAMIGVFNGRVRVATNYRTHYYSAVQDRAYQAFSISGEYRIRVKGKDYLGLSLHGLHDEAGRNALKRNFGHLGAAYHFRFRPAGYRKAPIFGVIGAQYGKGQYRIDPSRLWFSNQYNNELLEIDFSRPSGEAFLTNSTDYFDDYNVGAALYSSDEDSGFFFGFAAHHLSNPIINFIGDADERLYRKWTGFAGGQIPLSRVFSLLPGITGSKQGPSINGLVGANLRIANTNREVQEGELVYRAGVWAHFTERTGAKFAPEAVIVTGTFEYDRLRIGLSYDITVSALRVSTYRRGSFEISIIYNTLADYRGRVECPEY